MKTLSILILTLETRVHLLARLLSALSPQAAPFANVEILIDCDNGQVTIGEKRNRLLDKAKGDYVVFIDDDDMVRPEYVETILSAINDPTDPDAVGMMRMDFFNNQVHSISVMSGSSYAADLPIMHICPVRREIAISERFGHSNQGEDTCWAKRIAPKIRKEVFIEDIVYEYRYDPKIDRTEYTNTMRQQAILRDLGVIK